ncbi:MAG: hypothetical protein DMD90_17395 [Candidatus Rokuibacteriota bacterium]|nr:MAG: hypothetical protein DMD90_17395 [Candidatus Rokubacteria bacterium]
MHADYVDVIRRRLAIPPADGPDKVTTLDEAVRRLTVPGQTIFLGAAHGRPNALVRELVRQWWGRRPGWTLGCTGFGSPWTSLVVGGLVERLVTTFIGEGYPFPVPQALVGRAVLDGRVVVQNWSMLTLPLRLLAGAMGVPFTTTRSLLGSSMEEDNARDGDFVATDDPFGGGGRVGLVRAFTPDLALFHAWAADRAGNVIAAAPLNENFYAAMAARRGAIVSVEKIVSTEFIRRHAELVKLPGQYVAAVVEAPFGAHPAGMYGMNVPELEAYAEDLEFILGLRGAFRQPETAEAWIREWMLSVPDQAAYVAKLGYARIMEIKGRAHTDAWIAELESLASAIPTEATPNPGERMVVAAAATHEDAHDVEDVREHLARRKVAEREHEGLGRARQIADHARLRHHLDVHAGRLHLVGREPGGQIGVPDTGQVRPIAARPHLLAEQAGREPVPGLAGRRSDRQARQHQFHHRARQDVHHGLRRRQRHLLVGARGRGDPRPEPPALRRESSLRDGAGTTRHDRCVRSRRVREGGRARRACVDRRLRRSRGRRCRGRSARRLRLGPRRRSHAASVRGA